MSFTVNGIIQQYESSLGYIHLGDLKKGQSAGTQITTSEQRGVELLERLGLISKDQRKIIRPIALSLECRNAARTFHKR